MSLKSQFQEEDSPNTKLGFPYKLRWLLCPLLQKLGAVSFIRRKNENHIDASYLARSNAVVYIGSKVVGDIDNAVLFSELKAEFDVHDHPQTGTFVTSAHPGDGHTHTVTISGNTGIPNTPLSDDVKSEKVALIKN